MKQDFSTSSILMHLSRSRAGVAMFAPAVSAAVINHLTGETMTGQSRYTLSTQAMLNTCLKSVSATYILQICKIDNKSICLLVY